MGPTSSSGGPSASSVHGSVLKKKTGSKSKGQLGPRVLCNQQRHLYRQRTRPARPSQALLGREHPLGCADQLSQQEPADMHGSSQSMRPAAPPNPHGTWTRGAPQHPQAAAGHPTVPRVRPSQPHAAPASKRAASQILLLISVITIRLPSQAGLTFSYGNTNNKPDALSWRGCYGLFI